MSAPAPHRSILIENGTVVDGLGNAPRPAHVLIEDENIALVSEKPVPESRLGTDTVRIYAKGKTVMPGLIDAHCHTTFDEPSSNDELFFHRRHGLSALVAARNLKKILRAGVTGVLDADSIFELGIELRDGIEAGVIEGPRMAAGGYALLTSVGGTAGRLLPDEGVCGYATIVRSQAEIVREVRRQIKMGVDWIKIHVTGLTPRQKVEGEIQAWSYEELKVAAETAHELGIPIMGHCRNASSTRDAVRAGFDLILHATNLDEEALEVLIDAQTPVVPTLAFQANLADYGEVVGATDDVREIFREEIANSAETLRRAYDAGVPMLCGTESGFSITPYGDWHYREMEVFVKDFGLTPLEAIKCATSECARGLGLDGRTGAIEEGRLADIIVVNGDPSRDVAVLGNKANIEHVMVGGRSVDLSPLPPLRPIPGWRVSHYGSRTLTWDLVHSTEEQE